MRENDNQQQYNTGEPEQFRKLFIGGLNYKTSDDGLRDFYSQWGELTDSVVMKDGQTGKSRGFGFVTFRKCDMVDESMRNRPHEIDGRQVQPKRAVPREDTTCPGSNLSVKKIWIAGIKDKPIDKEDLEEYFKTFGNVADCALLMDEETGKNKGFAYIQFDDFDSVDKVILQKYHIIYNVHLQVKKAISKDTQGQKSACKGPRGAARGAGVSNFGPNRGAGQNCHDGGGNNFRDFGNNKKLGGDGGNYNNFGQNHGQNYGGGGPTNDGQDRQGGQFMRGGHNMRGNRDEHDMRDREDMRDGQEMRGGNDWPVPFGNHDGLRSSDDFQRGSRFRNDDAFMNDANDKARSRSPNDKDGDFGGP